MNYLAFVAILAMAGGLAGIVIPGIPGVLLVFGAAAGYGLLDRFNSFSPFWLLPMGAIAAAATAIDLIAAPAAARRFGASKWGAIGAIVGLVAGLLAGNILGALIGPFLGAMIFELVFGRTIKGALRSGFGTLVGYALSLAVDFTAAVTIIALFLVLVVT